MTVVVVVYVKPLLTYCGFHLSNAYVELTSELTTWVLVAQWLERLTCHQKVAGSTPVWGSEIRFSGVRAWRTFIGNLSSLEFFLEFASLCISTPSTKPAKQQFSSSTISTLFTALHNHIHSLDFVVLANFEFAPNLKQVRSSSFRESDSLWVIQNSSSVSSSSILVVPP